MMTARRLGDTLRRCGIPEPARWGNVGPSRRPPTPECTHPAGHGGPCTWEVCGVGATGDPFCDVECMRERGHDGWHRAEWGDE